ncbi:Holliday junction branch migration protein RuvA [Sedimentitalea arenosa]|uniref:Holliday junction branch migration complex subunit RuvA n=1 Tax=Sedimentitalea arenosa TaxID=2798803 RepID=A0A8J7LZK0_9RHOB|nr:Holliday junction branch migration protein RuvA [Arenibacterium arenosum]MBJ6370946.1 Holliday junction branch migration protein RuvA [Arenibacterium arenosum]
MIGRLRGRLDHRGSDHVLIDVQGVGYIVFCSERTLAGLPGPGEAVSLFTDLVVREDLMQLYGFPTLVEKEWHRLLCSVQGVGAKVSLAILGTLGPEGVGRAVALGDVASIKSAKGVGPKTAQRIVLDLKDKAPAVMALAGIVPTMTEQGASASAVEAAAEAPRQNAAAPMADGVAQAAALSALSNLGYAPSDAAAAVAEAAAAGPVAGEAELIRAALKLLAPKG